MGIEDCYTTWEKEENVPCDIIDEFDTQTMVSIEQVSHEQNGHTFCTLKVNKSGDVSEPQRKVKKCDRIIVANDSG